MPHVITQENQRDTNVDYVQRDNPANTLQTEDKLNTRIAVPCLRAQRPRANFNTRIAVP